MSFSDVFPEAHAQGSLCPATKGAVGRGLGSAWPSVREGSGTADFPAWVDFFSPVFTDGWRPRVCSQISPNVFAYLFLMSMFASGS